MTAPMTAAPVARMVVILAALVRLRWRRIGLPRLLGLQVGDVKFVDRAEVLLAVGHDPFVAWWATDVDQAAVDEHRLRFLRQRLVHHRAFLLRPGQIRPDGRPMSRIDLALQAVAAAEVGGLFGDPRPDRLAVPAQRLAGNRADSLNRDQKLLGVRHLVVRRFLAPRGDNGRECESQSEQDGRLHVFFSF